MIMCVLLCCPVSIHMSQLLSTGRPISSFYMVYKKIYTTLMDFYLSLNLNVFSFLPLKFKCNLIVIYLA